MSGSEVEQLIKKKRIYSIGGTQPADMFKAYAAWLPLAEAGDVKAQYNIGYCLSTGRGVDVHRKRAAEWFMRAAEQGDMLAHYSLFLAYRNGEGIDRDEAKASEHLQKAADLGDDRAFFELGRKHFKMGNKAGALQMFTKAKEAKHRDADKGIGLIKATIEFGRGTKLRTIANSSKTFTSPTLTFTIKNNSDSNLLFGCDLNSINERGNVIKKSLDIEMTPIGETTTGSLEMFPNVNIHETVELYQYRVSYHRTKPDWITFPLGEPIVLWTPEDAAKYRNACFVVTVCMHDETDPTVVAFRRFRDEVLAESKPGRVLSEAYYRHGPALAIWVCKHPGLRSALRKMFRMVAKVLLAKA